VGVVGNLPTTTGWQPVLPRTGKGFRFPAPLHEAPLELSSLMPTEVSIPDAEDLKSRVRELRRFL